MRKIILIVFSILLIFSLFNIFNNKEENFETKAVFISYIDYSSLKTKTKKEQQEIINTMVDNCYNFGLNTIILQVRPFSDAIYKSDIFLSSSVITNKEGDDLKLDILETMIKTAHEKNIQVHAWINPYRIRNTNDISVLNKKSPYYKWINTTNIEVTTSGIYLNPASNDVLKLILEGVQEIVKNYDIDGILYDDYFYPSKTIDQDNYQNYIENNNNISIEKYRITNINKLIKETYNIIKDTNKNVLFSISPSGNIQNNKINEYLDIKEILSKNGYIDYIIPQLYYGFENTNKPYISTINEWNKLIKNNTKLIVALSLYKSGKEDHYALEGKNEWKENNDILKKQLLIANGMSHYNGFAIYRYNNLFDKGPNKNMKGEIDNLKTILIESEKE